MIAKISNQNFGWSVACDGNWAAVGNPNPFRFNVLSASCIRTGSVEVYKYNINEDAHDVKSIIYRPRTSTMLISTEFKNSGATGPDNYLHTEYTGSIPYTADRDLSIELGGNYFTPVEDGYGVAVDIKDTLLAVGNPYNTDNLNVGMSSTYYSGSGYVDLYDLSILNIDPYATRVSPTIIGSSSIGGYIYVLTNVPALQNFTYVILQSMDSTPNAPWVNVSIQSTSNNGGIVNLQTHYTPTQYAALSSRVIGVIGTDPYIATINNPNINVSQSFGYSLSINNEWLAVGSPLESGSRGSVFMFRKQNNDNTNWSFIQTLPLPTEITIGDNFGSDVEMNKASSSFSWSMVVGSSKPNNSRAYVYEFNGTHWTNTFKLHPDSSSIYPLPFYPVTPIVYNYPNTADSFGHSVSMFGNSVMVGAPTDRIVYEYSGSSMYKQGAVYFFERCVNQNYGYYLARKSYGNENIMEDNLLGQSVSIFNNYAIAGVPKTNALSTSICYLRGSLSQEHYCAEFDSPALCGQFVLYNKSTGSIPDTTNIDWDVTNVYQVKKRFLSPHRTYGWDCCISSQFIIIGSPMLISGSVVDMDINPEYSTGSIGDLNGKSYIYNLGNLRENLYVGNVFYRNGKIVIMTSGSNFDGLQLNETSSGEYKYDINFTSAQTILEKQIICPIEPGEFNVSTNPSSIVLPNANFDINNNGKFDFQDADVLLRYMAYKSTEPSGKPNTDWTSSIIDTTTDEETSVYNMYSSSWTGTDSLFSSSYSDINNTMYGNLDFNGDNKINTNDMNILWKYFIYRLTQQNYMSYITPSSNKKYLSDIIDYMNSQTLRGRPPMINQNFLDYSTLTKQDPTGSYLAPTATSIGLYSGLDLVAIAKLGSPIKITPDFPINFVVKMDF